MKTRTATTISIAMAVFSLASGGGCERFVQTTAQPVKQSGQPPSKSVQDSGDGRRAPPIPRRTIADQKKWKATDFFESEGQLDICEAISTGDVERLKSLVKSGVELNARGKCGITALSWALFMDNMEAFQMLLDEGADPDSRLDEEFEEAIFDRHLAPGDTVLFTSLRNFRPHFCTAALKYSQNVSQTDRWGQNLLHVLLQPGNGDGGNCLKAMLDAGVDMNAKGNYGNTPCHLALTMTNPCLCLQLLQAGADPSIEDDEGDDLADTLERHLSNLAVSRQYDERLDPVIDWFNENYRKIKIPPVFAAERSNYENGGAK